MTACMSGNKTVIRRPTKDDIDFLVENIREDDVNEIKAIGGKTVRECINETKDIEDNSWVWEHEGKVMCIFGVNPIEDEDCVGAIWMLATKFFDEHEMIFAKTCKSILNEIITKFKYIFNYVHAENLKSIKWLEWLGFDISEAVPLGVNGEIFHRFEMWNDKCVIQ